MLALRLVFHYAIEIYDKNNMSKIAIACNIIKSLPKPVKGGYVLCDSWYSCKKIFEASTKSKYGAPKIHYKLSKKGYQVSLKRVQRIMRKLGIKAITIKKYRPYSKK